MTRGAVVMGESLVDIVQREGTTQAVAGGSPLNVAIGLARLGVTTQFATSYADDQNGRSITRALEDAHVTVLRAVTPSTSTAQATISADGSARYEFAIENVVPQVKDLTTDLVHTGSLGAFLSPGCDVIREALDRVPDGTLVSFDPNIRPAMLDALPEARSTSDALIARADIVKLSDEDADWLFPELTHSQVLQHLLDRGVRVAALTMGRAGSTLATPTSRVHVPAPLVDVADTVGAGDSYMSGLLSYLLSASWAGDDDWLRAAGMAAARNAAFTVQRPGAAMPQASDLR